MVPGFNLGSVFYSRPGTVFKFHKIQFFFHLIDLIVNILHGVNGVDVVVSASRLSCNLAYIIRVDRTNPDDKDRDVVALGYIDNVLHGTAAVVIISICKCDDASCARLGCYTLNGCIESVIEACHIACIECAYIICQNIRVVTEFLLQAHTCGKGCKFYKVACIKLNAVNKISHNIFGFCKRCAVHTSADISNHVDLQRFFLIELIYRGDNLLDVFLICILFVDVEKRLIQIVGNLLSGRIFQVHI